MVVIAGGIPAGITGDAEPSARPGESPAPDLLVRAVAPGTNEERVVHALLECVARWGLQKTTIDDVARACGLSRATVYRLFPGGKQAMVGAAARTELARLVDTVGERLDRADTLEDCLVAAVSAATHFLRSNTPFEYLRIHEPEAVEAFLAFDQLDWLLGSAAMLLAPSLERFLPHRDALEVGVWAARVVLSYLTTPAPGLDPADEADARRLVATYLLPGLAPVAGHPSEH